MWYSLTFSMFGVVMLTTGISLMMYQPLISYATSKIHKELILAEGTYGYDNWKNPADLNFRIYLFDVINPDDVMQGAKPNFIERGPYVYDDHFTKEVTRIDEERDEIEYNVIRTLRFNAKKSGNLTDSDQVTIINVAYLGTINTLASSFPAFLPEVGNDLPKLFPNSKSIFVKGRVRDIMFEGLPLTCNKRKYPELALICNVLKTKKPPLIRDTDRDGIYKYSFLAKINGTIQGPFTINRGIQNLSHLGDMTSIEGKRIRKLWQSDECNIVSGSDSVTWPPMSERMPHLYTYILDVCRTVFITYIHDIAINGILGWKYQFTKDLWSSENVECYCARDEKQQPLCLPKGLQDITKCQEAPVIMSEPHFLHADPNILTYAIGLHPKEEYHSTYLIIDPITGAPLAGQKKLQLNMKLSQVEVDLLANVSEGYFPLIWLDQGGIADIQHLSVAHQAHRVLHVLWFLQVIPLITGTFILLTSFFLLYDNITSKAHISSITLSNRILVTRDSSLSRATN